MVSKEGDHERGTYLMKTGYRPDPTVVHPSIGAICCHELPAAGDRHSAAHLDPARPVAGPRRLPRRRVRRLPDRRPGQAGARHDARACRPRATSSACSDLDVVESAFAAGRRKRVEATLHRDAVTGARKMMSSEQLKAFDVSSEPRRCATATATRRSAAAAWRRAG